MVRGVFSALDVPAMPGSMDVDEPAKPAAEADAAAAAAGDSSSGAKEEGTAAGAKVEGADKEKEKEKEPSSFTMTAPCRVVPNQVKYVSFPAGGYK